jgi:hypothetical protein
MNSETEDIARVRNAAYVQRKIKKDIEREVKKLIGGADRSGKTVRSCG